MRYALISLIAFFATFANAQEVWKLHADGFGAIRVGMTDTQVRKSVRFAFDKDPNSFDSKGACYYLHAKKHLPGVGVMIENGKVVRIDINERRYASIRGILVGDSQLSVISKYGTELVNTPEHYEGPDWRDLTAHSISKRFGIRYITDGKTVKAMIGGTAESIGYVEGCS